MFSFHACCLWLLKRISTKNISECKKLLSRNFNQPQKFETGNTWEYMFLPHNNPQYIYKWWIDWCLIMPFLFSSGIQWNAWPYLLQCNLCGGLLVEFMNWSKIHAHGWSPVSQKRRLGNINTKKQSTSQNTSTKTKPKQDNPTSNAPQKKTTRTTRVLLGQVIVEQGETAPLVRLNEMLPETKLPNSCRTNWMQDGKNSRLICWYNM